MSKLALGTVQFGVAYGITNVAGKVPPEEVTKILAHARAAGVSILDTAAGYGDSEAVLGAAGIDDWQVITKLAEVPHDCANIDAWVHDEVGQSLERLGSSRVHGLLLHRPNQLNSEIGQDIWQALLRQKRLGRADHIGYSIYDPDELDTLYIRYPAEIVQAPFNILDRRLARSGWLARLAVDGVDVHVRSAFLQGLLLMAPADRPSWTRAYATTLEAFDRWVISIACERHIACLAYCLSQPEISHVVIGVQDVAQLEAALAVTQLPVDEPPAWPGIDAAGLIDPRCWPNI